jgi:hypothetical protein
MVKSWKITFQLIVIIDTEIFTMEEITITNYERRRKWGWGYSFSPTGNGTEIRTPTEPNYTGTLGQISEARENDPILKAHSNCYSSSQWFWNGRPIVATWAFGIVSKTWSGDYNDEEEYEYGHAWFQGFHMPFEEYETTEIKIRIE